MGTLGNPTPPYIEKDYYLNSTTAVIGDINGTGIESVVDDVWQYQTGFVYCARRLAKVEFSTTNPGSTEIIYTDPQYDVYAFIEIWPRKTEEDALASSKSPWEWVTDDGDNAFTQAIQDMIQFYNDNHGKDPYAVNPDWFNSQTRVEPYQQNIWKRTFTITAHD